MDRSPRHGPSTTATADPQDFSERGPSAAGATRLTLDDGTPVEVFYPADPEVSTASAEAFRYTPEDTLGDVARVFPPGVVTDTVVPDAWVDVPADDSERHPVVVFSHGRGATRFQYSFHAAHLASWGFVVALPEHPERNLQARLAGKDVGTAASEALLATVALVEAEGEDPASILDGAVDTGRVAMEGHSAGGRDAAMAAYDPKVDTWIALAAAPPVPDVAARGHDTVTEGNDGFDPSADEFDLGAFLADATPPDKPSLTVVADDDVIYPVADRRTVYAWLGAPKRFAALAETGHVVFFDACPGIQEQGGLAAVAKALGLDRSSLEIRLSEDGCLPEDAPAELVAATWNHLAVAHLRQVFGIEAESAASSLDAGYLSATFPDRIAEYLVEE